MISKSTLSRILEGDFDIDEQSLRTVIGSHDLKIQLYKKEQINQNLSDFFSSPRILNMIMNLIFDENNSISTDFADLLRYAKNKIFDIILDSNEVGEYFYSLIRKVTFYPTQCTVFKLRTAQTYFNKFFSYLRSSDMKDKVFMKYSQDMFNCLVDNFNPTSFVFLFDFLVSGISSFILTDAQFEKILFTNQRVNPDYLFLIYQLYLKRENLKFKLEDLFERHFYSLFIYAISPDTSVFDSKIIFEMISEQLSKMRRDRDVKKLVYQFHDSCHPYGKSLLVKNFYNFLPRNYLEIIMNPDGNIQVAREIVSVLIDKAYKTMKQEIQERLFTQITSNFSNKKISDYSITYPFFINVYTKFPMIKPDDFDEYMSKYNEKIGQTQILAKSDREKNV
ncbi:hypothetical protein TVAG_487670 [Trichomonas vaginalis G3]|uniref:Uncharacterized protein n=1 Tax=Trichomonas vaginalis (strain ATCC PRA-98 / G3) TaxID=412133 RepID=A2EFP5_TRIV3|nr:hypothetical protein TVAG_487670 [Trichomonas vaginalis G3]|eukprot:XP_001320763.1 hypothetical protein [Trichomonas vaginalis G3]